MTNEELDRLEALANAAIKDGVIHRDNAFDIVRQAPALIEEIRRLRGLNEWQPIETAPKDGTKVWVWWETKGKFPIKEMSILQWRKDQWHWCESPNRSCLRMFPDFTPLLWMPLPQPPQSIGEQK